GISEYARRVSRYALFFCTLAPPPISTLFPYTTLFRSRVCRLDQGASDRPGPRGWIYSGCRAGSRADRPGPCRFLRCRDGWFHHTDRKSTRLNSSHLVISYAVFCLKKKKFIAIHATSDTTLLVSLLDNHP